MTNKSPRPRYNAQLFADDMGAQGWMMTELARRAGITSKTVTRFFQGSAQTPKTAAKMAVALGQPVERYLIRQAVAA